MSSKERELKKLIEKYRGVRVICPKCMTVGKLDVRLGYWICEHKGAGTGGRGQCLLAPIEKTKELLKMLRKPGWKNL